MNKKKSILHVNVGALSHSIHLNNTLNNNNHKSDFLTMYPLFKIDNNFRKNNTIISKSFFVNLYFFLYKFEKYNFIKKINSIIKKTGDRN